MNSSEAKERLLSEYHDVEEAERRAAWPRSAPSTCGRFMPAFLAVSLLFNGLLFTQWWSSQDAIARAQTPFARLTYNTPTTYHNHTDYMSSNETLAYQMWSDIDTSPLQVALTDEYAEEHNLGRSVLRFPWDESKGIYFLKAYHHLHCLKVMRRAYMDLDLGNEIKTNSHHVYHCFDALRQDLMCNADDTPMAMFDFPNKIGDGQVRMCRNMDQLIEWTREPERNPCYKRFTDYGALTNRLEQYAFCEEDSPYYDLQQAYFEKWGHKDLYAEEPYAGSG